MTNAVARGLMLASVTLALLLSPVLAVAQSGSTGGSIGNDDTSVSGKRDVPQRSVEPDDRPARHSNAPAREERSRSQSRSDTPAPRAQPNPQGLIRMGGAGGTSDGNCKCKSNCRSATPLNPALTAQCMQSCESTYSGCNRGMPR